MNVIFWNVNKNDNIDKTLALLVLENNVDLLVLAEYNGDTEILCKQISNANKTYSSLQVIGCDKIKGIVNSQYSQEQLYAEARYSIIGLQTACFKLIVSMIHGESNLHYTDDDRMPTFCRFYKDIEESEKRLNCGNTIVIGDFNSNPFDRSVMSVGSLHAIPYREEVKKETREVSGAEYKKFYNPMWKFLGNNEAPYGTYYYNSSKPVNYYWNIFDQVIIRPSLCSAFSSDHLKIITEINQISLLKNNYKPDTLFSDHLPIFFKVVEEKII